MSGECLKCGCDSYESICWNCERIEKLEQQLKEAVLLLEQYHECYKIEAKIKYQTTGDVFLDKDYVGDILKSEGVVREYRGK